MAAIRSRSERVIREIAKAVKLQEDLDKNVLKMVLDQERVSGVASLDLISSSVKDGRVKADSAVFRRSSLGCGTRFRATRDSDVILSDVLRGIGWDNGSGSASSRILRCDILGQLSKMLWMGSCPG